MLVVGGQGAGPPLVVARLASAELYDPAGDEGRGLWRSCGTDPLGSDPPGPTCPGPMAAARTSVVATALDNGKVLVFGSEDGSLDRVGPDAEVYDPDTGTWAPTATPAYPLGVSGGLQWKAVLLRGGKVLTVNVSSKQAQLFTAAGPGAQGGTWEITPGPLGSHTSATLTGLGDGRALLVGGSSPPEVYDATAAIPWSFTGPMATRDRRDHTATLLAGPSCQAPLMPNWCGKVLVVGGARAANQPVKDAASAEIFDPTIANPGGPNGAWALASPDPTKAIPPGRERYQAKAASLRDGSVLVVGGDERNDDDGSSQVAGTMRFDPVGGWAAMGQLGQARNDHVATSLPTGEVLVAGGFANGSQNPVLASTEIYRPPAGFPTGPAPRVDAVSPDRVPADGATEPRLTISGARLSGALQVFFGPEEALSFKPDPSAPDNRLFARAKASTIPGPVHVTVLTGTGGPSIDGNPDRPPVLTYLDSTGGTWEQAPLLAHDRALPTATAVAGGKILVTGGRTTAVEGVSSGQESVGEAELYDPAASPPAGFSSPGQWRAAGSMVTPRVLHTAALLGDGSVLAAGGVNDPPGAAATDVVVPVLSSAERWLSAGRSDGSAGAWSAAAPMSLPRAGHTATRLDGPACAAASAPVSCGDVLVVGGDRVGTAELYDSETRTWVPVEAMGVARARHTATLLTDGRVLVAGGEFTSGGGPDGAVRSTAQLFDPRTGRWTAAGEMHVPRTRHTATLLPDGRVLVAGGDEARGDALNPANDFTRETEAHDSAEIFDSNAGATEVWGTPIIPMLAARSGHSASLLPNGRVLLAGGISQNVVSFSAELLDPVAGAEAFLPTPVMTGGTRFDQAAVVLPAGPVSGCGAACGAVLLVGGRAGRESIDSTANTELFFPTPEISAVAPDRGVTAGGTPVTITGTGLAGVTEPSQVLFGGTVARSVTVESDRRIVAVSPRAARPGPVDVRVTGPGGTSAIGPAATFTYFVLDRVLDLAALADTETSATLTFTAPGYPPATRYVIKQSDSPITDDASFAAAEALCGGVCEVPPGESVSFRVGGLSPGRTYHFALRALDAAGQPGPLSNPASVTTLVCPARPAAGPGQVIYPSGYSLVGAPDSSVVPAVGRLYGWFDRGAGAYSVQDVAEPVLGGRGYWAWFLCPRLVDLAGPGTTSAAFPLGAYHASMVGNPSATGPVSVAGADYAARWLPGLNDGAGGYEMSGLREPKTLAIGEGAWVFSFSETTVRIGSP